MARAPLLRSAGVRLAGLYGVLFALSSLALVFFLWFETVDLLQRQVEAAIIADAQGLIEQFQQSGLPGLVITIQTRLLENVDDDAVYYVTDPLHRKVTGNLSRWPESVQQTGVFYELPLERGDKTHSLLELRAFSLGGAHLIVGRDVRVRSTLVHLLRNTLLSSFGVVLVLGIGGAWLMRDLFRRMVSDVTSTSVAIAGGDLAQRVRRSGRGDEFDQMAEAINAMLSRMVQLMDGVRQVSNNIAHDLRTPIARARARLEDAALHAGTVAELRAAVERAVEDLDGVTAVFAALLRIAEVEAGARRAAFATLDCADLLRDLAELYAAAAEEAGLLLATDIAPSLPAIGDRDLLQQAVANLLDNAIKFSPPGGTVRLRAASAERGVIEIDVADEGPGIPEADRARATERFFRGEAARHTPGSGLGLSLVQAVAVLHNGSLSLGDASPGLVATLRLAISAPDRLAGPSPRSHPPARVALTQD